ncbi:MAG TPA: hypothetical protein VGK29_02780 [Paludibaculum sp.]
MYRVLRQDDPVHWLDAIIVIRAIHCQVLVGQQRQVRVRHHRRVPVACITAMHVGERGLSEAKDQSSGSR